MKRHRFVITVMVGLMVLARISVLAHHAPEAEFDLFQTKQIMGKVNRVEWTNPHPFLHILVQDNGKEVPWEFELDGIQQLQKVGLERTFLKWGDGITVEYSPARNGTNYGIVKGLIMADGRKFIVRYGALGSGKEQ